MHSEMSDAATPSTGVTSSRGTLSHRKLGSMRHPLSQPSKLFALPVKTKHAVSQIAHAKITRNLIKRNAPSSHSSPTLTKPSPHTPMA